MKQRGSKKCSRCGKTKELSEFPKDKVNYRSYCKDCNRKRVREYWAKHPEQQQKNKLKYHYGMTVQEYTTKLLEQNGVCAICGKPETKAVRGKIQSLSVDHNHDTGVIRGLLCSQCNSMLGFARDSSSILSVAADYLDSWSD